MFNKISVDDKERLVMFQSKLASLGFSSDWGLRLAMWNNKLNDLTSITFNSSSSNDNNDARRPPAAVSSSSSHQVWSTESSSVEVSFAAIVTYVSSGLSILGRLVSLPLLTAPFAVVSSMESISVTTSVAASSLISSPAIPTAAIWLAPYFSEFK
ncbi:hypothetical protein Hanom_Chr01g00040851 [Helianthus anomalus]